jgi:hypothetical protein
MSAYKENSVLATKIPVKYTKFENKRSTNTFRNVGHNDVFSR